MDTNKQEKLTQQKIQYQNHHADWLLMIHPYIFVCTHRKANDQPAKLNTVAVVYSR